MSIDLEISFHTLSKNFRDLLDLQEKYLKNRQKISYLNFGDYNKYILELTRLLHNYLASYSSFVDCMRTSRESFGGPEFEKEFAKQIEEKRIEERTRFIKDLRNFSQHKRLPIVGFRVSIVYLKGNESTKPDQVVKDSPSLRVNDLLEWRGWTSFSKQFLNNQPKELPIMPLIVECQNAEDELYTWLLQKKEEIKKNKIIKDAN